MRVLRLLLLVALLAASAHTQGARFDVLIRGGRVLDDSGNPFFFADVAIRRDAIVAVGELSGATAARVIDARGERQRPRIGRRAASSG